MKAELTQTRETLKAQIKDLTRQLIEVEAQLAEQTSPHKVGDIISFTDGRGTYRARVKAINFADWQGYSLNVETIRKDGSAGQTRYHIAPEFNKVTATN